MSGQRPRAWLLMGHKAGDNTQILALAEALGWPFDIKHIIYRRTERLTNRLVGESLAGIVAKQSSPLAPPLPDLVLTAGRRNEPVARWIRTQGGGKVKLVHVGRPWGPLDQFDLIVTTPQYRLPVRPNILHNTLPLHRVSTHRLAQATEQWASRLAHLPRPYIAVLVGGNSGAIVFDPRKAAYMGQQASAVAERLEGALLVTTSARTPSLSAQALEQSIRVPHYFFHWTPASHDNPYYAFLALADAFIVTGESVSMLAEACYTRQPVYIFDIADERTPCGTGSPGAWLPSTWQKLCNTWHYGVWKHRLAQWTRPRRVRTDIGTIHRRLIESGRAAWLGGDLLSDALPPPLEDLDRAVARVRALFDQT